MKLLLTLDEHNYTSDMPVKIVHTARAIIVQDGKIAMQQSKIGWFKIPGGGIEGGESPQETLVREVAEEVGLIVKPETIEEIGKIIERREDRKCPGQVFERHSLYYKCEITDEQVPLQMTESEKLMGFHPVWVEPETIIAENIRLNYYDRDTDFFTFFAPDHQEK